LKALVVIFEELVPISGGGAPRTFNIVRALAERGREQHQQLPTPEIRGKIIL